MSSSNNDLEARMADLSARQHALRQLVSSAGWRDTVTIADGAVTTRRQSAFSAMSTLKGMDDCIALARLGAEIAGMQFVLALPHIMLADAAQDMQRLVAERRETEENG